MDHPLIQYDVKVPSKREAHRARAQFLALCWTMFMLGWTNGSTGPLLPRIQIYYDVSRRPIVLRYYPFDHFFDISIFQIGLGAASWIFVLQRTVSDFYGAHNTRMP